MSDYENNMPRELGWDDEIKNDSSPYEVLPEGDYEFRVEKFERARHGGSDKIPACNKAILTLDVTSPQGSGKVQVNLFLHSKFEWKLCQFFTSVGARKRGEPLRMNWNAVAGATGRCHIGVRKWIGTNDGKEHEGNEVTEFFEPEELPAQWQNGAAASSAGGYTPGKF